MNYIAPVTCKCGVKVQIHEYLMDLGDNEQRDRGYCPIRSRFLPPKHSLATFGYRKVLFHSTPCCLAILLSLEEYRMRWPTQRR